MIRDEQVTVEALIQTKREAVLDTLTGGRFGIS